MTTFDRFDPFERRIGEALEGIAPIGRLDYLDDVFRQTARTAQRPRWSFPERWFNVDTTFARPMLFGRHVPFRSLIVLAVLLALVTATAFYFGTQKRLPPPYGPAANGQLIYGVDGDLYLRESLLGEARLLLAAPGNQTGVVLSPDGQLVAFDNYLESDPSGDPFEWVANLDGSNPRQILDRPFTFEAFEWAPDSKSILIVTRPSPVPELWIAPADGSGARQLEFDAFVPWSATWDPTRPGVMLVRGEHRDNHRADLYYVRADGAVLDQLFMTGLNLNGPSFEFSGTVFSPDGQTIAYNAIVAEEAPFNRFRAHLINRDGTNDREIPAPFEANFSQAWPAFSPDGKWILLSSWRTMPDGSIQHRLAIAPADLSAPARLIGPILDDENQIKTWSPDGSQILLCACEHQEVYTVDPVSGGYEKLPWQGDAPSWQRLAR